MEPRRPNALRRCGACLGWARGAGSAGDARRRRSFSAVAADCLGARALSGLGFSRANGVAFSALLLVLLAERRRRGPGVLLTALFALATLSERLFVASEQLAFHFGAAWQRALVYSLFSNTALMLFTSSALQRRALRMLQLSLLGSVLYTLLAVPGSALLLAGLRQKRMALPQGALNAQAALLVLMSSAVLVPTMLVVTGSERCTSKAHGCPDDVLALSRASSAVLLLVYTAWMRFTHGTHAYLFAVDTAPMSPRAELDGTRLSRAGALAWTLVFATCCAFVSAVVVDALHGADTHLGLPREFLAAVVVPAAANLGDHAAALAHAARGAGGAALHVGFSAATQIALCLLPSVVCGAALQGVPLGLTAGAFEASTLMFASVAVTLVLADGQANWLKGATLLAAYVIVAAAFGVAAGQQDRTHT